MNELFANLRSTFLKLFGYKLVARTLEEEIDYRMKEKPGDFDFDFFYVTEKRGRVHATLRLIEQAKESLYIKINHHDFEEIDVMNDSYIYSALYDAAKRGVNIKILLTHEAHQRISQDILGIAKIFISRYDDTDFFSSMKVDGKLIKCVKFSMTGRTVF